MALKVPDVGEVPLLQAVIDGQLNGAVLHLYKNNYTPVDGSVLGDFTEANFSGYATIGLTLWTAAGTNIDGKAETDHPICTFTVAAGGVSSDVYGIYVTDPTNTVLLYAEKDPAGVVSMTVLGQTYSYTPKFTLNSEF